MRVESLKRRKQRLVRSRPKAGKCRKCMEIRKQRNRAAVEREKEYKSRKQRIRKD
jgi:hypothetical protein